MKQRDYRWLVVFAANLLLLWLCGLANHSLAPLAVYLFIGGLLPIYAALRLDAQHGYTATLLTALAADSLTPVPFGTSLALFGLVHTVIFFNRQRFPREEPVFATFAALVSNLFVFLAQSFILIGRHPRPSEAWERLFVDLLASQLALAVITAWFWSLQNRSFELLRQQPETGRRIAI